MCSSASPAATSARNEVLFRIPFQITDEDLDQVLSAHARSEEKEEELRATPRWRFRRRRQLERSLERRQAWEETVREGLVSSAKSETR